MIKNLTPVKSLLIFRGYPGAGKTTTANIMLRHLESLGRSARVVLDTDSYFEHQGSWTKTELPYAHALITLEARRELFNGHTVLVTGILPKFHNMDNLFNMASDLKVPQIVLIDCFGSYQNIHGVTEEEINNIKSVFEPSSNIGNKMKAYNYDLVHSMNGKTFNQYFYRLPDIN